MHQETEDGQKVRLSHETAKEQFEDPVLVGLVRGEFLDWMLEHGKEKDDGGRTGLSLAGAKNTIYRLDQIQRFCHTQFGHDPLDVTPQEAEEFADALLDDEWPKRNGESRSDDDKRKLLEALEKYFGFQAEKNCRDGGKHNISRARATTRGMTSSCLQKDFSYAKLLSNMDPCLRTRR